MSYLSSKKITSLVKNHNYLFLLLCLFLTSCLVTEKKYTAIPPGEWRGILYLGDNQVMGSISFGETGEDEKLPFIFEVDYIRADSFIVTLKNGDERIVLDQVSFGHNRTNGRDSVIINFPEYGSYIMAYYEEDILEGRWYVPSKGNYSIPFLAKHGEDKRFFNHDMTADNDVTGKWETSFGIENKDDEYPAIGEFKQVGNKVTGTFRTETGDYRYLDGIVDEGELWLSTFDGAHAFLFKSKIIGDSLTGFFKSGNHYQTLWSAVKNESASLVNPDEITKTIDNSVVDFSWVNQNGDSIKFSNIPATGKPQIIQILGSWCPNCKDEVVFLTEYLKSHPDRVDITAIAFERSEDVDKAYDLINNYKDRMDIPYPMYWGGKASKKVASSVFPFLSGITSFPTMIFLTKDRKVHKIHTGFNGPATSEYKKFKEDFYRTLEELNAQ